MCGIAELYGEFRDRDIELSRMLSSILYRGPDEAGEYSDDGFIGGMRRLSINDVVNGSQPLFSQDKSSVLFYSDELYNSPQLRRQLEVKGIVFRTHA